VSAPASTSSEGPLIPPELDPLLQESFDRFVETPEDRTYLLVRQLLVDHADFQPQTNQLEIAANLLRDGENEAVLRAVYDGYPTLLLSPSAHLFASLAADRLYRENGGRTDYKVLRDRHGLIAVACLTGIASTGDGSSSTPFLICLSDDITDLLRFQDKSIQLRRVRQQGNRAFAVVQTLESEEIWFDITDTMKRLAQNGGSS